MFQLTIKYTNIIHSKAQNLPKLRFWFATSWQPWFPRETENDEQFWCLHPKQIKTMDGVVPQE
jgi:uncharacterized protein (DUF924 family)